MDKMTNYRQIIKEVISQYSCFVPSHGNIRLDTLFDETQDRYALMQVGWNKERRVRGNLIYITLQNGKVFIEYDGVEIGITQDLVNQGILEEDIVFAYLPQDIQLTA